MSFHPKEKEIYYAFENNSGSKLLGKSTNIDKLKKLPNANICKDVYTPGLGIVKGIIFRTYQQ